MRWVATVLILLALAAPAWCKPAGPTGNGPVSPKVWGRVEDYRTAGLLLVTFTPGTSKLATLATLDLEDIAPDLVGPEAICAWHGQMTAGRLNRIVNTWGVERVEAFQVGGGH